MVYSSVYIHVYKFFFFVRHDPSRFNVLNEREGLKLVGLRTRHDSELASVKHSWKNRGTVEVSVK